MCSHTPHQGQKYLTLVYLSDFIHLLMSPENVFHTVHMAVLYEGLCMMALVFDLPLPKTVFVQMLLFREVLVMSTSMVSFDTV